MLKKMEEKICANKKIMITNVVEIVSLETVKNNCE